MKEKCTICTEHDGFWLCNRCRKSYDRVIQRSDSQASLLLWAVRRTRYIEAKKRS